MKWEPLAIMALLLVLGAWLAYGPNLQYDVRPGATTSKANFGGIKGELEIFTDPATSQTALRLLYPGGGYSQTWTAKEFDAVFGEGKFDAVKLVSGNWLFRTLNVTTSLGVTIVAIGFLGQAAFSGRWLVQWIVSEKRKDSYVPESFWWFSLFGGAVLFGYFVWRQDIVAVLGQTSGVVVYARNIRLLRKAKRREAQRREALNNTVDANQPPPKSP